MQLKIRFLTLTLLIAAGECLAGGGAHPEHASHAMVASQNELASQVGVQVMKAGGNSVDAAVATGFALAVVHPNAGNIGGGGFMLIRTKSGDVHFLDFRETAPARATEKMYQDAQGKVIPNLSVLGYQAVGVPSSVKGLVYAEQHFGRLTLTQVMAPAIRLAREGYALSWGAAHSLSEEVDLARFPDSRRIFQNGGRGWHQGDLLKQPELARTLERIAAAPDDFYKGLMAREIADFMRKGGGLITTEDLANYQVKDRPAVRGKYRGVEIISAPPPSSGGTALIESLNILEHFDLTHAGMGSARSVHLIAESYRRAFFDRAQFMGDPDFAAVPVAQLTDKDYALAWGASIDSEHPSVSLQLHRPAKFPELDRYAREHPVFGAPVEPHHTTHYSVVDPDGGAVAVTTTLNDDYGSRVTIGSLGFLLNNEMDDFASKPGVPNIYGLIQGDANSVGPNKRPLSAMTPTIVLKEGKLWMVLGAEGGPTIITSVANILIGVRDYGLDIQEAVNAPRIHQQWLPDRIELEKGRFSPDTELLLQEGGNKVTPPDLDGDAECIAVDLATGERLGASDARNESGRAVGY
ncbi:MAG: gamma-glutamyltranspeptidase / glutathione hydrolase [Gammaproteobacteria bacterium]|nr:gamma-glutamyltranspeptidase / glutathione hydrolase [Gammaproteobacteria bacterium]